MIFTYFLFFFLYLLFSSSIHTGVHAQSEDGSTNPIDTKEPPARLVCCFFTSIYFQSNHNFPLYIRNPSLLFFFFLVSSGLSLQHLERSNNLRRSPWPVAPPSSSTTITPIIVYAGTHPSQYIHIVMAYTA